MRSVLWFIENCNNGKIGGNNLIVEINEILFTKYKNNCGRVIPQLVLGGYVEILVQVPAQSFSMLMDAIINNV